MNEDGYNDRKFTQNARKMIKIATITQKNRLKGIKYYIIIIIYMFGKVIVKFDGDCLSSAPSLLLSPSLIEIF